MIKKTWLSSIKIAMLIVLVNLPAIVFATSCWDPEPEEYLASTSLIFKGTVISVETLIPQVVLDIGIANIDPDKLRRVLKQRTKFRVAISYKGSVLDEVNIDGGNFVVGEKVTVFANGNLKDGFTTHMCTMMPYHSAISQGDMRFQLAIEAYRDKRNALAKVLQENPTNQKLLLEQALFFVKYNDDEQAESVFTQILLVNPKDVNALVGRADIRYKLAYYETALADYRAALQIGSNNQEAKYGEEQTLLKLKVH
jgi:tetratricopeptide (TPR) repeat protein